MSLRDSQAFRSMFPAATQQIQDLLGKLTIDEPLDNREAIFSHLTVLLVEKEGTPADIIKGMFAALGVRDCIHVANVRHAMNVPHFDLVIAGDALTEREVIDFATWVRQAEPNGPTRQFISLRTQVSEQFARQAKPGGIDDIVINPIPMAAFLARIFWVLLRTRGHIESPTYRGPDRRFRNLLYSDVERRKNRQ